MSSQAKRALVLAAWAAFALGSPAAVRIGDAFPSLAAPGMEGAAPGTRGRIVLVDFWASWCAPCRESFPAYARLERDFAARGLVIVAVSVDQSPEAYAAFLRKFQPPFATLRDRGQALVRTVDVPAMPSCYLLGRDGRVRYIHPGFRSGKTDRELRHEIESLLNEEVRP